MAHPTETVTGRLRAEFLHARNLATLHVADNNRHRRGDRTNRAHRRLLIQRRARRVSDVALRESEERYRDVVESQTDMVCRFLPDTTLTFVNNAYCRFFGRSRDEMIG